MLFFEFDKSVVIAYRIAGVDKKQSNKKLYMNIFMLILLMVSTASISAAEMSATIATTLMQCMKTNVALRQLEALAKETAESKERIQKTFYMEDCHTDLGVYDVANEKERQKNIDALNEEFHKKASEILAAAKSSSCASAPKPTENSRREQMRAAAGSEKGSRQKYPPYE